ncbi:MAG: protein tyrosine phosphatase [Planctomycetaceae bacterium]|nr:protein tyrosine phosphatase [Planctomycetaceae bacterium]
MRKNILFVCSKNRWRSPTAEAIYQADHRIAVRSRGTARTAVQRLRRSDFDWADAVLVMETKHRNRILADFPSEARSTWIYVLDVPDDYQFMNPELVELLQATCEPIIENLSGEGGEQGC